MAISSDQPISAANLKAVVEKLMGGGYLPETLLAVNGSSCEQYVYLAEPDRYARYYVEVGSGLYHGKSMFKGYIENKDGATATFTNADGTTTTVKMMNNSTTGRYIAADYDNKIYRVVGYR